MSEIRTRSDLYPLAVLAIFGLSALTIGVFASREAERRVLELGAEQAAVEVAREIDSRLADLTRPGVAPAASPFEVKLPPSIGKVKLFTRGEETPIALPGGGPAAPTSQEADLASDAWRGLSKIEPDDSALSGQHLTLVSLPLVANGAVRGVAVFSVDQTVAVQRLAAGFNSTPSTIALIVVLAIGAPMIVLWLRSRENRRAEDRLSFISYFDVLTALPNRAHFTEFLNAKLAEPERRGAIFSIDLDRFKAANDSYGMATADSLLQNMAVLLRQNTREGDSVARVGADEFALLIEGLQDAEAAMTRATLLCEALSKPQLVNGRVLTPSVSIGVALYPDDGRDAATVMRNADFALERVKAEGGNGSRLFDEELASKLRLRREIEQELRDAIESDGIEINYQAQCDLSSGRVRGYEALVRWTHPELGAISPARFIPLAEETGLIVPLGEWILRRACRDAMTWSRPHKVAVNLSPAQFRKTAVADMVERILAETGLPAERLELEITESIILDNERAPEDLARLRALGVSIALDDFGTGYSSLSYLVRFPFSKIKIDQSFVRNLGSETHVAIVQTIVALGRTLGVTITAEGVESAEQAAALAKFGCNQGQGFFFGRAVPTEAVGDAAA